MVTVGREKDRAFRRVGNVLFLCDSYTGVNFVIIPQEIHYCFVCFFVWVLHFTIAKFLKLLIISYACRQ